MNGARVFPPQKYRLWFGLGADRQGQSVEKGVLQVLAFKSMVKGEWNWWRVLCSSRKVGLATWNAFVEAKKEV